MSTTQRQPNQTQMRRSKRPDQTLMVQQWLYKLRVDDIVYEWVNKRVTMEDWTFDSCLIKCCAGEGVRDTKKNSYLLLLSVITLHEWPIWP